MAVFRVVGQFEISPANSRQPRYMGGMTGKAPKRPRDANQLAKLMVDLATGDVSEPEETTFEKRASKGGAVGGPARAKALTSRQRSEIASLAAQARWKKKD
jgi:hypothetical protein